MQHIKLSVPNDPLILEAAGNFLKECAERQSLITPPAVEGCLAEVLAESMSNTENPSCNEAVPAPVTPPAPAEPQQGTFTPPLPQSIIDAENAPEPPAPAAAATPAPPANGVELDADGIPWDERIHSSNKSKVKATQKWMLKRGFNKPEKAAFVQQVLAELKGAVAAPPAAPAAPAPAAPPPPPPPASTPEQAPPPPPAAPTGNYKEQLAQLGLPVTTFPEVMVACFKLGIREQEKDAACKAIGLDSPTQLNAQKDMIPAFCQVLGLI